MVMAQAWESKAQNARLFQYTTCVRSANHPLAKASPMVKSSLKEPGRKVAGLKQPLRASRLVCNAPEKKTIARAAPVACQLLSSCPANFYPVPTIEIKERAWRRVPVTWWGVPALFSHSFWLEQAIVPCWSSSILPAVGRDSNANPCSQPFPCFAFLFS